jgi:hypothetical protein
VSAVVLTIVLLGCSSSPPSEKPTAAKLEIKLAGPDGPVKVGQPVPIRIEVLNAGKSIAEYSDDGGDRELRSLHVVTPDGRDRTFGGVRTERVQITPTRLVAGESHVVTSGYDLRNGFDLSQAGTYRVSIQRVHLAPDLDPVDSNEISIKVESP